MTSMDKGVFLMERPIKKGDESGIRIHRLDDTV